VAEIPEKGNKRKEFEKIIGTAFKADAISVTQPADETNSKLILCVY